MKCHAARQKNPPGHLSKAAAVCAILLLSFIALGQPAARQFVHRYQPERERTAEPLGRVSPGTRLTLAIGLPLRNQEALHTFLQQLHDPGSTNYHHYLIPEQFTERFGPTKHDYEAVKAFAEANGLKVLAEHRNRLLVEVNGTVTDIERTLHTTLRTYKHPTETRTFYAPATEPSVDLSVPVASIGGLDNYALPRPRVQAVPLAMKSSATPNDGSGPGGYYSGYDFRAAYAPDTSLDGTGQVLGLLQFDGYDTNDIDYYETQAGLPSVTLSNVLLNGASGIGSGGSGQTEASLDIEMAISMAPGLSEVIVYEAPNPTPFEVILSQMAENDLASQLSCSWFLPNGADNVSDDEIFLEMDTQGQSFLDASGDKDAYTGLIDFPSDNPYITQVGGTSLTTDGPGGAWVSESVWNRDNGTGSGGGISTQYGQPDWQTNIDVTACMGSATRRNVPDVAMAAENIYVRSGGVDYNVGGTSAAAPLWAGFTALINQQAAAISQPRVGFLNPLLSPLAAGPNYPSLFHDITNGDNTSSSSPTNFFAVPGYDLCTGWGTPMGQDLIDALAPLVTVTLPASATKGDGVLAGAGEVQLWTATPTNLDITLTSSDTNHLTVPPTVTVMAGQNSATFDVTIVDDMVLDGTARPIVTAYAPGYGVGIDSMYVFDNETATLQMSLPATATEGDGTVQGTVTSSAAPVADIPVSLSSSDLGKIQVPASVVLPAGQTSVVFTATVVDNDVIDGPQSVTVTAHVMNWTDGSAIITVLDNESLDLAVTLPPSVNENAGTIHNAGTVTLAGTLTTNLTVTLISSDTNRLTVPNSFTIFAGQLSGTFDLTPVDNNLADGNESILVTASAPGFTNGTASVLVIDDETPLTPSNPRPADTATDALANTNLMWSNGPGGEYILNGGFETGTFTNWYKENSGNGDFVINDGTYQPASPDGPTPPYAGLFSALSDQNASGKHVLYQDITLPPGPGSFLLSWVDRIRNFASQFASNQYFRVEIRDTNDNLLQLAFTTNPGGQLLNDWTNRTFNLASYAGQTIRVAFVQSDNLFYFNVHLDNISVQVNSAASGTTNDVYFGTDPTPGPDDFQGSTTNQYWTLPLLAPQTTYYWQIVARKIGTTAGPVWQFTTAGVDHFAWSPIPSLQFTGTPIAVNVTALDAFGTIVTNFTGPIMISGAPDNSVSPNMSGNFTNGVWSGEITLTDRSTNEVLIADDGDGHLGTSNPFNVAPANMAPIILTQPVDQIAETGATITFSAQADGTPYLYYQWEFNDTNEIAGATNSVLTLTNIQLTNAGSYSVTVTNQIGLTNSSEAMLSVVGLDHFAWSEIPSPRFVRAPFTVSILAQDTNNGTFTNFSGTVLLSSTNGGPVIPTVSGSFTQGSWSGAVKISQVTSNLVLQADDGAGHTGASYPIDVVNVPPLRALNVGGSLQVSWPASPSGFILESSDSLLPADWEPASYGAILTNNQYIQSFPMTETNQFFRLRFPGP